MHNCNTNPVVIGDVSLNILLYADDIVLLSESKEGLQNSLDELYRYCSNWKLQINSDKSKIIVFKSNGRSTFLNELTYDNCIIETVTQYCYLSIAGIEIGKFKLVAQTRFLIKKMSICLTKLKIKV